MVFGRIFGVGDLDEEAFAQLYIKLGKRAGVFSDPEINLDTFTISDSGHLFGLGNIYRTFLGLPRRHRHRFLMHVLTGFAAQTTGTELPKDWETAAPRLRPQPRDATFLDLVRLEATARGWETGRSSVFEEIAPNVYVTLVIDSEHAMATVSRDMLEEWGVTFEEARHRAQQNLLDDSLDPFEIVAPGLWAATWQDSYAAARITLPHVLQQVTTDPVVAIPNRDLLLVAKSRSPEALELLVTLLEESMGSDSYSITRQLLRLDGKDYRPFDLPEGHSAERRYDNLKKSEMAARYADLKDRTQEVAGEELFVASQMVLQSPDGALKTVAVWSEGVPSLLPTADEIHFLRAPVDGETPTDLWEVPWREVEALPGALDSTDYVVPRWRTGDFPSAEFFERAGRFVNLTEKPKDSAVVDRPDAG